MWPGREKLNGLGKAIFGRTMEKSFYLNPDTE
jgi:hypothetical protein